MAGKRNRNTQSRQGRLGERAPAPLTPAKRLKFESAAANLISGLRESAGMLLGPVAVLFLFRPDLKPVNPKLRWVFRGNYFADANVAIALIAYAEPRIIGGSKYLLEWGYFLFR